MSTTNRSRYPGSGNQNSNKNKQHTYRPKNGNGNSSNNNNNNNNNNNDSNTHSENEKDNIGNNNNNNNGGDVDSHNNSPIHNHSDVPFDRNENKGIQRDNNTGGGGYNESNISESGNNNNKQYRNQQYSSRYQKRGSGNQRVQSPQNQPQQRNYRTAVGNRGGGGGSGGNQPHSSQQSRRPSGTTTSGSLPATSSSSMSPPRRNSNPSHVDGNSPHRMSPSLPSSYYHRSSALSADGPPPGFDQGLSHGSDDTDPEFEALDNERDNAGSRTDQRSGWRHRKENNTGANSGSHNNTNRMPREPPHRHYDTEMYDDRDYPRHSNNHTKKKMGNNTRSGGDRYNMRENANALDDNGNHSHYSRYDEGEDIYRTNTEGGGGGDESWGNGTQPAKAYNTILKCMRDLMNVTPTDLESAEKVYQDLVSAEKKMQAEEGLSNEKEAQHLNTSETGNKMLEEQNTTTRPKERKYSVRDLIVMGAIFQEMNEHSAIPDDVRYKVNRDGHGSGTGKDQRRFPHTRLRSAGGSSELIGVDESPALPPANPSLRKGSCSSDSIGRRLSSDSLWKLKRELNTANRSLDEEEEEETEITTGKSSENNKTNPTTTTTGKMETYEASGNTGNNPTQTNSEKNKSEGSEEKNTITKEGGTHTDKETVAKSEKLAETTDKNTKTSLEQASTKEPEVSSSIAISGTNNLNETDKDNTERILNVEEKSKEYPIKDFSEEMSSPMEDWNQEDDLEHEPGRKDEDGLGGHAILEMPFTQEEIGGEARQDSYPEQSEYLHETQDNLRPRNITPPLRPAAGEDAEDDEDVILWEDENIDSIQKGGEFQFACLDKAKEQQYLNMHGKLPSDVYTMSFKDYEKTQQEQALQQPSSSPVKSIEPGSEKLIMPESSGGMVPTNIMSTGEIKHIRKPPVSSPENQQHKQSFFQNDKSHMTLSQEGIGRASGLEKDPETSSEQALNNYNPRPPGRLENEPELEGFGEGEPNGPSSQEAASFYMSNNKQLTEEEHRELAQQAFNKQRLMQYRKYAQQYGIPAPTTEQERHYRYYYGDMWEKAYYKRQIFKKHQQQQQARYTQGAPRAETSMDIQDLQYYKTYYYNQYRDMVKKAEQNPKFMEYVRYYERKVNYVTEKLKELELKNAMGTNKTTEGPSGTTTTHQGTSGKTLSEQPLVPVPTKGIATGDTSAHPLHTNTQMPVNPSDPYGPEYYGLQRGYGGQMGSSGGGGMGMEELNKDQMNAMAMQHGMDSYYGQPSSTTQQTGHTSSHSRMRAPYGGSNYGYMNPSYTSTTRQPMPPTDMTTQSGLVGTGTDVEKGHKENIGSSSSSSDENALDNVMDINLSAFGYRTVQGLGNTGGSSRERSISGLNGIETNASALSGDEERNNDMEINRDNKEKGKTEERDTTETNMTMAKSRNNHPGMETLVDNTKVNSNPEDPKLPPTTVKDTEKHSTSARDKAPPFWFYHGFELYRSRYNPEATRTDVYWAKYLDIKGQQWNNQLYFKKMQSGDAAVRNMAPPPRIQLGPDEQAFFTCVEYYRKRAKLRHAEKEQQMHQNQQHHQHQNPHSHQHSHQSHQSQQHQQLQHQHPHPLQHQHQHQLQQQHQHQHQHQQQQQQQHQHQHQHDLPHQSSGVVHPQSSHMYSHHSRSGMMSPTNLNNPPQSQRGPIVDYPRSPAFSPPMTNTSTSGTTGTSGMDMYYGSQPPQYSREMMNRPHPESQVGNMSPLIDPSGHRTQYPNVGSQQQGYHQSQRQGTQSYPYHM